MVALDQVELELILL
jgi:hypothetical protein